MNDSIRDAESAVAARERDHAAAVEVSARADAAVKVALDSRDRARELATLAAAEHNAAAENAVKAENAWQTEQTPGRWSKVESARSGRDQSELRVGSMKSAAASADVDHATAERRAAAARNELHTAAVALERARDVLAGLRASEAAADEESAAREGARLREVAAVEAAHGAFGSDFEREVAPLLTRYASAVATMNRTLLSLEEVLTVARERGARLLAQGQQAGIFDPPPRDLVTKLAAAELAAAAAAELLVGEPLHPSTRERRLVDAKNAARCKAVERRAIDTAAAAMFAPWATEAE